MNLIVFDTNIIKGDPKPTSAFWKSFREYRKRSGCAVAIPQVVLYELPRKLFFNSRVQGSRVTTAVTRLMESLTSAQESGWELALETEGLTVSSIVDALRSLRPRQSKTEEERLRELLEGLVGGSFRTLPLPQVSHDELVRRCCIEERKPFPASKDVDVDHGDLANTAESKQVSENPKRSRQQDSRANPVKDSDRSYRDALIWFGVLDEAAQDTELQVVFVSSNVNDFADASKTQFHEHLIADMEMRGVATSRLTYCPSLEDFVAAAQSAEQESKSAEEEAKSAEEEDKLRTSLRFDTAFLDALQLSARELAEPLMERFLAMTQNSTGYLADFSIGIVSLLSIQSVRQLASAPDLAIKAEVSVRGTVEFVLTDKPYVRHLAQTVKATIAYNRETVRVTGVTIEYSEPDLPVNTNRRITTSIREDDSKDWTITLERVSAPGARFSLGAATLERIDELTVCLRDLQAPTGVALHERGSRVFSGDDIPMRVLMRWGLIRIFSMWEPRDAPVFYDVPGYYFDVPPQQE